VTLPLAEKIAEFCQKNSVLVKEDRIVIGVSGGPDSLCLLHLLKNLAPRFDLTLTVAHLNHQLRGGDAQADEDFVREIAARWRLPIFAETRNIAKLAAKRKQSIEEAARQVRYAFLWQVAQDVDANKIAVGHNADDQVETVLMHFLRGTGLSGLRGMLPIMNIANLRLSLEDIPAVSSQPAPELIRPLLETPRVEIEAYCQTHNLTPRQDYSNQDTTLFRNRLRHELIPQLETYNPNIRQVLQRTAKVAAAEVEFLNEHVDQAWRFVIKDISLDPSADSSSIARVEIDLSNWLRLPLAMKRATLRRAVQTLRRSLRDVNFEHIETAIAVVEKGNTGAQATLPQGLMLTVGYDSFTITAQNTLAHPQKSNMPRLVKDEILPLKLPGTTPLPHTDWQLKAELLADNNLNHQRVRQVVPWEVYLDADVVGEHAILRPRRPGDTFCPLGLAGHHKKVNEFMINEKIPADQRNHLPLLVANNQILWVCGYRPDERARLRSTTQRIFHLKFELI
jgi:tRNA(Ile)-lysidine synthase